MSDEINWDRIRFRPPICYFPIMWELIINRELIANPELAEKYGSKLVSAKPSPDPWSVKKHLTDRINITKNLIADKKLDKKIGAMVITHLEQHVKEIDEIQAKG